MNKMIKNAMAILDQNAIFHCGKLMEALKANDLNRAKMLADVIYHAINTVRICIDSELENSKEQNDTGKV